MPNETGLAQLHEGNIIAVIDVFTLCQSVLVFSLLLLQGKVQ